MAGGQFGVIVAILAGISALPTDHVIYKLDPSGPRYQYMNSPAGPELVDLWMKTSDVLSAARYNPEVNNGYHLFTRSNPTTSQPIPLGGHSILKASNFDAKKKTVFLVHGWRNTPVSDFNVYLIHGQLRPTTSQPIPLRGHSNLKASNFDAKKKTVFLVHGWRNTPVSDFNVYLIHAYLAAEDVNIILVDWSIGAGQTYMVALNNSIRSAEHVARFITWLNGASGAKLDNYHVIGHSLGAHQSGIVGRQLGGGLAYITALDPALPGWITNPSSFRATDGVYTEVIHTDAGFSGLLSPVGDVDFYPNGGRNMPGCDDWNCGHHRCIFYMAESLTSGGFTGTRCEILAAALTGNCTSTDTLKMGGRTAKTGSSGLYYLPTNANSPFSQG
ncbi:hypothetical protein PYW07_012812 [Mythimna separata]|uniref:Lipase domain-containing protein n=1 Tax=Mythimna separata TaxID=271217 RepID=A0AAD7Y996_MYTSE|nr:hypothetical protein PYW07_012812 [Mythimna separata]